MSVVYDQKLRDIIKASANKLGITLREGVYLQLTGPGYETPAEIRMCRILGADAVGMSTACEAIAARHMGLRVCGVSCVSNLASGISQQPLSHKEISETADRVSHSFQALVTDVIAHIGTQ
jgi:purine-nucleoside phosphorylase